MSETMSSTKNSRSDPAHMARKEEARQRYLASKSKPTPPLEEKEAPPQRTCLAGPLEPTRFTSFVTKMYPVSPRKRVGDRDAQFLHALKGEDIADCSPLRKGSAIQTLIQEQGLTATITHFQSAREVIQSKIADHVEDGDVILIHSESDIFTAAFCQAKMEGKSFRVVVCENKPFQTHAVKALVRADIDCTSIILTAVAYMMEDITKVFLTADVIQPASIIAKPGAGMIAVVTQMNEKPLYLFYEAFKETSSCAVPSEIVGEETPCDVIPRSFFTELVHE